MKTQCSVCHRWVDPKNREVFQLTPDEKTEIAKMGLVPAPNELTYCKPCLRILRDKNHGAQLISGLVEHGLRRHGVVRADLKARQFQQGLLNKVKS